MQPVLVSVQDGTTMVFDDGSTIKVPAGCFVQGTGGDSGWSISARPDPESKTGTLFGYGMGAGTEYAVVQGNCVRAALRMAYLLAMSALGVGRKEAWNVLMRSLHGCPHVHMVDDRGHPVTEELAWNRLREEFATVRAKLQSNRPSVLGLLEMVSWSEWGGPTDRSDIEANFDRLAG